MCVPSGRLGHSAHGGSGWCSLKIEQESRSTGILITVLGNDLWIYLTVVVVTVLYFTTHYHMKHHAYVSDRESERDLVCVAGGTVKAKHHAYASERDLVSVAGSSCICSESQTPFLERLCPSRVISLAPFFCCLVQRNVCTCMMTCFTAFMHVYAIKSLFPSTVDVLSLEYYVYSPHSFLYVCFPSVPMCYSYRAHCRVHGPTTLRS